LYRIGIDFLYYVISIHNNVHSIARYIYIYFEDLYQSFKMKTIIVDISVIEWFRISIKKFEN